MEIEISLALVLDMFHWMDTGSAFSHQSAAITLNKSNYSIVWKLFDAFCNHLDSLWTSHPRQVHCGNNIYKYKQG